jgi:predicted small lipoprotein YifL
MAQTVEQSRGEAMTRSAFGKARRGVSPVVQSGILPADGESAVSLASLRFVPLVLALGLAGCGVRGPLEPPPDAGIAPNANATYSATVPVPRTAPTASILTQPPAVSSTQRGTTSAAVVNAPAAQRNNPLDWLTD